MQRESPSYSPSSSSVALPLHSSQLSDVVSGWIGWVLEEYGRSVNPILTRGADYAHHITACPPGFENLTASLEYYAEIMTAHTFLKLHSELFRTYEFSNLLKSQNRKTPIQL